MREKHDNGEGRLPDDQNETKDRKTLKDISHIDQQEGNMHRGETGGNFSDAGEEREQNEKNPQ